MILIEAIQIEGWMSRQIGW